MEVLLLVGEQLLVLEWNMISQVSCLHLKYASKMSQWLETAALGFSIVNRIEEVRESYIAL